MTANYLYVALGSAIGGVLRVALGAAVQQRAGIAFPVGTLTVNVLGSFLIGLIIRYATTTGAVTPEMRIFLTAGFCGGFTTFSAFSLETVTLMRDGEHFRAGAYVVTSVVLCIAATYLGLTRFGR